MVVHTKQISPVEQLAEQLARVARASSTASGVALTQTGVPGGFMRSLFVALSFVVFGMVTKKAYHQPSSFMPFMIRKTHTVAQKQAQPKPMAVPKPILLLFKEKAFSKKLI